MTLGSLLYGNDSIETILHNIFASTLIQDCPSEYFGLTLRCFFKHSSNNSKEQAQHTPVPRFNYQSNFPRNPSFPPTLG